MGHRGVLGGWALSCERGTLVILKPAIAEREVSGGLRGCVVPRRLVGVRLSGLGDVGAPTSSEFTTKLPTNRVGGRRVAPHWRRMPPVGSLCPSPGCPHCATARALAHRAREREGERERGREGGMERERERGREGARERGREGEREREGGRERARA